MHVVEQTLPFGHDRRPEKAPAIDDRAISAKMIAREPVYDAAFGHRQLPGAAATASGSAISSSG
jgi:hypothetical protein